MWAHEFIEELKLASQAVHQSFFGWLGCNRIGHAGAVKHQTPLVGQGQEMRELMPLREVGGRAFQPRQSMTERNGNSHAA